MAAYEDQLAIVAKEVAPFHRAWVKKIVKGIGTRPIHEVLEENGARQQNVKSRLREAEIFHTAQETEVIEARAQLEQATQQVATLIDAELSAAREFRSLKKEGAELSSKKNALRADLLEAQRKLTMLEVLAVNHAKLKEIKQQQASAMKAAEDAKRMVLEHKRLQKDVAEATRRAQADLNGHRHLSAKRMLRGVTYHAEEPNGKFPRRAVTYEMLGPHAKATILTKQDYVKPPSPSNHEMDVPHAKLVISTKQDDVKSLSPSNHSDTEPDEVGPTIVQATLSHPATTIQAQLDLARSATETLLEDAQPFSSF